MRAALLRTRLAFVLVLASALSLLTLDFRGFGPLETAQNGLRAVSIVVFAR